MHNYSCKAILRLDAEKKDGTMPIVLQCFINGRKVRLPLGIFSTLEDWNKDSGQVLVTGRGERRKRLEDHNSLITHGINKVTTIFLDYKIRDEQLSTAVFKDEFQRPSNTGNFEEFYKKEALALKGYLAHRTTTEHLQTLKKLLKFKKDITFGDMTPEFVENFEKWMKRVMRFEPNTRHKHHKNLKKFLNVARRKGMRFEDPYRFFTLPRAKTEKPSLSQEELKALLNMYEAKTLEDKLHNVLEYFLFSCFTGLRYSDVVLIDDENIIGDELVFRPVKTQDKRKILRVPLNDPACGFRTKLIVSNKEPGTLFPNAITNQKSISISRKSLTEPISRSILHSISPDIRLRLYFWSLKVTPSCLKTLWVFAIGQPFRHTSI